MGKVAHKATITAKQGPGGSITSKVINGFTGIHYELDKQLLQIRDANGVWQEFDLAANTTLTLTFASGNYTLSVS